MSAAFSVLSLSGYCLQAGVVPSSQVRTSRQLTGGCAATAEADDSCKAVRTGSEVLSGRTCKGARSLGRVSVPLSAFQLCTCADERACALAEISVSCLNSVSGLAIQNVGLHL